MTSHPRTCHVHTWTLGHLAVKDGRLSLAGAAAAGAAWSSICLAVWALGTGTSRPGPKLASSDSSNRASHFGKLECHLACLPLSWRCSCWHSGMPPRTMMSTQLLAARFKQPLDSTKDPSKPERNITTLVLHMNMFLQAWWIRGGGGVC